MRVMRDHIEVARRFPGIETNTAYSFGLDDQEFVVAFDADDPAEFLDLVQELRATESSAYTESETPIFTCIAALAGTGARRAGRRGGAGAGCPGGLGSPTRSRAASSSSSSCSASRAGGRGARRPPSRAVDRLPARVGHVVGARSASSASSASRLGSAGSCSRPASRSPSSGSTVSWASRLLVPMIPVGPRLIQPTTYSPRSGAPCSSRIRPPSFGIVPRRSSNGRPSSGDAAVADRAEHDAAGDRPRIVSVRAGAQRRCPRRAARCGRSGCPPRCSLAQDLHRRDEEAQHDPARACPPARGRRSRCRISTFLRGGRAGRLALQRAPAERVELDVARVHEHVGVGHLAQLEQLRVGEGGLRRPAPAEHHDLLDAAARRAPRARGRPRRSRPARRAVRASMRATSAATLPLPITTARSPERSNSRSR